VRPVQFGDRASGAREGQRADAEGKEVKFFCVGRKGYEHLRRTFEKHIIEHVELRGVRTIGFDNAQPIAKRSSPLREGRVRRLHAVLLALQVGDRADPDRAAGHPRFEATAGRAPRRTTNTSRTR
jgi:hypothetical protein